MSKVKHMSDEHGETHRWFCKCGCADHVLEIGTDAEFYGKDLLVTIYLNRPPLRWDPREWRHNLYILKNRIIDTIAVLFGNELAWTEVIISEKDRQDISDAVKLKEEEEPG